MKLSPGAWPWGNPLLPPEAPQAPQARGQVLGPRPGPARALPRAAGINEAQGTPRVALSWDAGGLPPAGAGAQGTRAAPRPPCPQKQLPGLGVGVAPGAAACLLDGHLRRAVSTHSSS